MSSENESERQQLYESQTHISDEVVGILKKLQEGVVKSPTIAQYKKYIAFLEDKFKRNNDTLNEMGKTSEDYFKNNLFEMVMKDINRSKAVMQGACQDSVEDYTYIQELIKLEVQQYIQTQKENKNVELVADNPLKNNPNGTLFAISKEEVVSNLLGKFRKDIQILKEYLTDDDGDEVNVIALEHKRCYCEKQMEDIKKIHHELFVYYSVQEDIDEELECIKERYKEASRNMLIKIKCLKDEEKRVVLKPIEIPIFSGNIEEWPTFHNLFTKFIHMTKLSTEEKLLRLKSHLSGEALKTIQNYTITRNGYKAAWIDLNRRYNNQRNLLAKFVDKILDQSSVHVGDPKGLRNLLNLTNENIQSLKAMGVQLDDSDPIIARIILRKLDKSGLTLFEQRTNNSQELYKLKDVLSFIESQCAALEVHNL